MRVLLLCCLLATMCLAAAGQIRQSEGISQLRSSDVAYADAIKFAQFLNEHNFNVQSIHGSVLNGFFRNVQKAAYFKTDKGIVEVIFFPDAGAEKISVNEQRQDKGFIYSFQGQPHPNPPGDTFNAGQPMYFIMRDNLFIVTFDEKLSKALKSALTKK